MWAVCRVHTETLQEDVNVSEAGFSAVWIWGQMTGAARRLRIDGEALQEDQASRNI